MAAIVSPITIKPTRVWYLSDILPQMDACEMLLAIMDRHASNVVSVTESPKITLKYRDRKV